jgi:hypothetical protein
LGAAVLQLAAAATAAMRVLLLMLQRVVQTVISKCGYIAHDQLIMK